MKRALIISIGMLGVIAGATLASAQDSDTPIIGDERAVTQYLSQDDATKLSTERLIQHGKMLFSAKFTSLDGAGRPHATQAEVPTKRELGGSPAFFRTSGPEANACDGCHNQPFVGGAGEFVANVFASEGVNDAEFDTLDAQFSNERGTPPIQGAGLVELLAREMSFELQSIRNEAVELARNTGKNQVATLKSKGVSFGKLTAQADGFIKINEIEGVDFDLVVRPFSQKGVFTSLRQFSINAMNAHHGMQAAERYGDQWTNTDDFDGDGFSDELKAGDISAIVAFQATLPTPQQNLPEHPILEAAVARGEKAFSDMNCDSCHRTSLPLNSLSFVEPNPFNSAGNLRLSETEAAITFELSSQGLNKDEQGRWLVPLFSDLKRHVIADDEKSHFANELLGQRYIPRDVFMTSKLWTVGNTAPFGHRGDITTIREAILHHGGEAKASRLSFEAANEASQADVIEFLKSLQVVSGGIS